MKNKRLTRGSYLLLCMLLVACGAVAEKTVQLQGLVVPLDTERIDFRNMKVQNYDALKGFLFSLPALTHVDMYATPISGAQADELTELFPGITFGWTLRIRCKDHNHDIRTDATAFSTLHNKRSPKHTSDDFRMLKYCKNLLAHGNFPDMLEIVLIKFFNFTGMYSYRGIYMLILWRKFIGSINAF